MQLEGRGRMPRLIRGPSMPDAAKEVGIASAQEARLWAVLAARVKESPAQEVQGRTPAAHDPRLLLEGGKQGKAC